MNEYLLIKFLHVVGFAYWLGGDLGVFHSSYWVANPTHSPEVRVAAAKILFWLDQVPRICMTMMLPLGLHLAWRMGALPLTGVHVLAIWVLCFGWLGMVVYLHAAGPSAQKTLVTRVDLWFRLLLALTLLAAGLGAAAGIGLTAPLWVAVKLAIFGGMIVCGLLVRLRLKDFGPAFARIASGTVDDETNETIRRSLGGTRPFVVAIWAGLLSSAALGLHLI